MPGDAQSIQSGEIARSVESFTQAPAVGMVVVPSGLMAASRETIAALAARHRLPAVYALTHFAIGCRQALPSAQIDFVSSCCDAHSMSGAGHKRTWQLQFAMSALPPKADIPSAGTVDGEVSK